MNTSSATSESLRTWARTAGIALLVICGNLFLSNDLVTWAHPQATADAIAAHQTWFRIGILGDLIMAGGDAVLAVALYRLLHARAPGVALLGTVDRLINAMLLVTGALASSIALDLVTDSRTIAALSNDTRLAAMQTLLDWHATAMSIGLVFWGFGAALHSVLLWRARLIPRVLSGAYAVITAALGVACTVMIVVPAVDTIVDPWMLAPDFLIEIAVALWLTFGTLRFDPISAGPSTLTTSAETPR